MVNRFSILVVDDNNGITETLEDILSDIGYVIDTAGDGYSAIEKMENKTYNLALLDIKMNGINGVETFKEIKRISPKTIVLMMTAYSLDGLVKEAIEGEAYGIFYKPLDMDKVLSMIKEIKGKYY